MVRARGSDAGPAAERPAGRAARIAFRSGIVLVVAGLVVLGYVGWQVWGTTVVAKREQRETTTSVVNRWREQTGGRQSLRPQNTATGDVSALVRIPTFGREYVVPVLEGTSPKVLTEGFGHFAGSADPGEVGNYALAAHRVTHGEPLRRMPELRPGDEVVVETVDATFTYALDTDPRKLVIPFTGTWVLEALPVNPDGGVQPRQEPGQRLITLTTCAEIFHTDDRMIAFGHLVRAVEKDGPGDG
jgi:sortase A